MMPELITKQFVTVVTVISTIFGSHIVFSQDEPLVPFKYALGMEKFQEFCGGCHGNWGKGSDKGPPLLHEYYKTSHHGVQSFHAAALKGVSQHHWNFGDMPAVAGIVESDVDAIIPFVRWLQQEAGIE